MPVRLGCQFCLLLFLLSPSSQPPVDRVSPNVALKLIAKPILFTPAEWSERLTPGGGGGGSGWLRPAAVGSVPLSLFFILLKAWATLENKLKKGQWLETLY